MTKALDLLVQSDGKLVAGGTARMEQAAERASCAYCRENG